jgi:hypothetical protein
MPPAWTDPCNGHFSHELIRGKCPIEIAAANRVVTGGRRSAAVGGILPSSLQDAISTSELAYLNTVDHTTDVGFDFAGSTIQELYDAAKAGVINAGDAMGELGGRIPSANAADQTTIGHTISALENLVKVGHIVKNPSSITGNYLRVWSITTKKMKRLSGPILVVEGNSFTFEGSGDSDKKSAKFSVDRMSTERLFDACIYQWTLLVHTLGIMPLEISASFVFDTVHLLRVRHGEDFWTAQEYFIACLDLLDRNKIKADQVPNHDRGVMLSDARRFGEQFKGLAANASRPTKEGSETKEWNGEFQSPGNSKVQPCPYFNNGKKHDAKHLTSAGKCIFRHVCNHWVSDKGPGGRCESGDHNWPKCDHAQKCDKKVE